MATKHGDLDLLNTPLAQQLLRSSIPARLAYVWRDGTPRVVPVWFQWNGKEIVVGTPLKAPKNQTLRSGSKVAVTIDTEAAPYKALQIRGTVQVDTVEGLVPEYVTAAERYFGAEQGRAWIERFRTLFPRMVRIAVKPEWADILDFEQRFPSAVEAAMAGRSE
ncbi:MAG TPA: pyridoxamine 5'-phosphate oxidase family protein [Terriglobia bacterium]|nr:pyridoxamine 5'-phosphate oxidase family protein [Terriglobia bacterium]